MGLYLSHGNEYFQQVLNGEVCVDKTGYDRYNKRKAHDCVIERFERDNCVRERAIT